MQQAAGDPLIGRLLERRYRIVGWVARGGMSTVYRGVDLRLDRRVAIKIMAPDLAADPQFVDRFSREARAAASLTHVNAVAVFDQGIDATHRPPLVFLVMELIEGRTLRDLIRERAGRFTPAEAVSIMEPVLSALSAAHRAGLVHRDVKPENILLSSAGLVKVADFGLARAVNSAASEAGSTRTGLMGTVAYCAPEQIMRAHTDQRSDVYSAGIVLFELLTGRPPFPGGSAVDVAYQHVHNRVPAPSSRRPGLPPELDAIVAAATHRDPGARPADAAALLAELADVRSALGLPVMPVPLPLPQPDRQRSAAPAGAPAPTVRRRAQPDRVRNDHTQGRTPAGPAQRAASGAVAGSAGGATTTMPPTAALPHGARAPHDTLYDPPHPSLATPLPRAGATPPGGPRRRRRLVITLVLVALLGAAAVLAGFWGVHKLRQWSDAQNMHVPELSGYTVARARHDLRADGYQVDPHVTTQFSDTVDKNEVVDTSPAAGQRLPKGSTVRLIVSLGPDMVPVPQVHDETLGAATSELQGQGFVVAKVLNTPSIKVPAGKVITTRPHPGTLVHDGGDIVVLVSSGLPTFPVPDIAVGTSFRDARDTIEGVSGADFKVHRVAEYNDDVPAGEVIGVEPEGGAQPYGTTFTVHVSRGPRLVNVPDFAPGTTLPDYERQLDQLGLHYTPQQPYSGGDGTLVLATDPPAGTPVHVGDTITVIVY